jgi:hypothetical protein
MRATLRFPSSWLVPLWVVLFCQILPAQLHKVDPKQTVTFEVAGATAAYSLDASLAEATVTNGLVAITGKQPGSTHIIVISPLGVQTFEVQVTTPAPHYPPGFVMPVSSAETAQSGYYEGRYYSSPAQVQNQFDFLKIHGDDRTHVHVVETSLIGPLEQGLPRIALSSASYQIVTPRREITLFDQSVEESPLTLNGSIVRGFHMRQDRWFGHAGYTTMATFQGLFLPIQPELVVGGGYRLPLKASSSITASFYHFHVPVTDRVGRSGDVATVTYKYSPRESFRIAVDAGISHGIAGAGLLNYKTERDNVTALARYEPRQFASLGVTSFRGFHGDFSWTHHVTKKFNAILTFYNSNLILPGLKETTVSGSAALNYQLSRHWAITGGAIASRLQTKEPLILTNRSFTLPAGLSFQSKHFGATGQYQFAATPGLESGGKQFRASLRSGWGAFTVTGYGERDTNAPTLSFILGQVAGLQQDLNQLGIKATTVQQMDELLSNNAFLIAAGYIKGATINLVPVRSQLMGTVDWAGSGARRRHLTYSFLYNDNHSLQGSTQVVGHTLSYSQSLSHSDDVSLACSVMGTSEPGRSQEYAPVCFIAFRHQFRHVPKFIVPERTGTITGTVFRDDQSKGVLEPGMRLISEVEIVLDDRRRTFTRPDGSYLFPGVSRGVHRIAAIYHSREPFFFTTPSNVEVEEDATTNFGIGHTLSGLMGSVLNDAGKGVADVKVVIGRAALQWSAVTEADGTFFVSSLIAGDYRVHVDEDSLPMGYSAESLPDLEPVRVKASSPGNAAFRVRALRSISGRVVSYDSITGRYVPVAGARVDLKEPGFTIVTDVQGRYMFRDLAAGAYSVSVSIDGQKFAHTISLGAEPVNRAEPDFQIAKPNASVVPVPK